MAESTVRLWELDECQVGQGETPDPRDYRSLGLVLVRRGGWGKSEPLPFVTGKQTFTGGLRSARTPHAGANSGTKVNSGKKAPGSHARGK